MMEVCFALPQPSVLEVALPTPPKAVSDAEHLKQYDRMLWDTVRRAMPRIEKVDPSMNQDELHALLLEVYVKCKAGFDESKGWKFTTYLQNAMYHELNRFVDKLIRQRGFMVLREDMVGRRFNPTDQFDVWDSSDIGLSGIEDDAEPDPFEAVAAKQHFLQAIAKLSAEARMVVRLLMAPTADLIEFHRDWAESTQAVGRVKNDITIDVVCQFIGLKPTRMRALRRELSAQFAIDFKRLDVAGV